MQHRFLCTLVLVALPALGASAAGHEPIGVAASLPAVAVPYPDPAARDNAIEAARKRVLDPSDGNWKAGAAYLASQPKGRPVLEEIIILFRVTDHARWTEAFTVYVSSVRPRDVSDRMLPEYLAHLTLQRSSTGAVFAIHRIAEFGVAGQSAIPTLEWIRSFSRDPQQVEAAIEAIRRLKGGAPRRLTGC